MSLTARLHRLEQDQAERDEADRRRLGTLDARHFAGLLSEYGACDGESLWVGDALRAFARERGVDPARAVRLFEEQREQFAEWFHDSIDVRCYGHDH
jgi:hypothetical protein